MVLLADIKAAIAASECEYVCQRDLDLYKTSAGESLVTQAAAGRHLRLLKAEANAIAVRLLEDDYPGWITLADGSRLRPAEQPYQAPVLSSAAIQARLSQVVAFAEAAMNQPNVYLWGGTAGPNYDCSGLMQAAFASAGIRLPRDAYQQAAFAQPLDPAARQAGDLVFFGSAERITHVALMLDGDRYLHSSGKAQGRNGIGLDTISNAIDPVSRTYRAQLRGFGRIVQSYQSTGDDFQAVYNQAERATLRMQ
ncbi:MAG: C40 family peptidase [Leptolyngbyaceae cyanobacterium SM1_1_3]|nr:C40 family peptidase [Leptolyngbyaceae cyanobacterium SM1_1_3]NJN05058.1 C40 family peptidase [Leptolyngbyaceae cyanobacterium RM1_1_2]NJO10273.1 C40 family peptidase [Leptolyngbyaceae cyanobacterium SL_1_1]